MLSLYMVFRSFWICLSGSTGNLFSPISDGHPLLEGVCFYPEWTWLDLSGLPLCSWHVLWLAIYERTKLWYTFFFPGKIQINLTKCHIFCLKYALYIPFLTMILKLPLVLPPLSNHLTKIRAGHVRGSKGDQTVWIGAKDEYIVIKDFYKKLIKD